MNDAMGRSGARMAHEAISEPRAVLLDVLGTMLRLEPPGPRLRRQLIARAGVDVGEEAAAAALGAEIAHYLENQLDGRDEASLAELHQRCAGVLRDALGRPELELDTVREAMLASTVFTPFDDVVPALEELRGAGLRLIAASNWDVSLDA